MERLTVIRVLLLCMPVTAAIPDRLSAVHWKGIEEGEALTQIPAGTAQVLAPGDTGALAQESPADEGSSVPEENSTKGEHQTSSAVEDASVRQTRVEEAAKRARENPFLREYFLRIFQSGDPFESTPRLPEDDPFVQAFVDRQIENFVVTLDEKLRQLEGLSEMSGRLVERWVATESDSDRRNVGYALIATLKQVEDSSDNVADRLAAVLLSMDRKVRYDPKSERDQIGGSGELIEYVRDQLQLLTVDLRAADRLIRDYFFGRDNLVRVEDLGGANMLQRLYSVRERAKHLQRVLRADLR